MSTQDEPEDRRNRFLADSQAGTGSNSNNTGNGNGNGGNGGGQRAASQPPHHNSSPFLSPTIPSSLSTGGAGGGNTSGPWAGLTPSSVSTRSASFSAPRFASTFEDDELVDPEDELYDARYHSPTSASSYTHNTLYRGRPGTNAPPDFSRSRSQSLATATAIGTGRAGGGLGSGYAVGSAANSYSNAYLYGNNAYGHPYGGGGGGGGGGGLSGSLGGGRYAGSPLVRSGSISSQGAGAEDGTNMSPFVRDVGSILLDDGSFRELWERERGARDFGSARDYGYARDPHPHPAPTSYSGYAHPHAHDDPASGTTSRRHSVSVVQPRRLAGFNVPDSESPSASPSNSNSLSLSNSGSASHTNNSGAGLGFASSSIGRGGGMGGGGGLLLSDDDLELGLGLGSLSLSSSSGYGNSSNYNSSAGYNNAGYNNGGLYAGSSSVMTYLSPSNNTSGAGGGAGRRREDSLGRGGFREEELRGAGIGRDVGSGSGIGIGIGRDVGRDRERERHPGQGSLPIHAPAPAHSLGSLVLGDNNNTSNAGARGGGDGARGAGDGARGVGGANKDWAGTDAYFSPPPPREQLPALNTNVGGGGAGVHERKQVSVSPVAGTGAGRGQSQGGYGQQQQQQQGGYGHQQYQQPPYSPHSAHPSQYGGGGAYHPSSAHPSSAHPSSAYGHGGVGGHGGAQGGGGQGQERQGGSAAPLADLGKGLPLHAVPPEWPLYIVEFKAGRTDLFYRAADRMASHGQNGRNGNGNGYGSREDDTDPIRVGDLVIVEADRGKDLGKVVNDSITLGEVEAFWAGQQRFGSGGQSPPTSPGGADGGGGGKKEIAPKMIYGKAGAGDAQLLVAKMQDELKALALCQTKVRAKKLPMEVVDAEYQWDRRKLTFYFVAEKRIDFRELVRELFRLYKTRIWMASLQGAASFDQ